MRHVLFILLLIIESCKNDTSIVSSGSFGNTFTLKVGQTVTIQPGNLKVGFERVASDSRCPTGAMCFWEGMAQLRLWLLPPGTDTVFVQSTISGYVTQSDTCCHKYVDTVGYRVKLMQLDPYPRIDGPLPPESSDYIAYLQVSKL